MCALITGIGWVTPAGHGWGQGGQEFIPQLGTIPMLTRKEVFSEPNQRFGRQSDYSKLGVAAIAFALRDAGLETWTEKRPIGIVAASRFGCLATDLDYYHTVLPEGGGLASPNLFAYTLANCFMGEAAIQFGLTGSTTVINESGDGGLVSLRMALESIDWEEHVTMLAGVCDLPVPDILAGFSGHQPGALFMVLSSQLPVKTHCFGTLSQTGTGSILYDGEEITGFVELARTCLSNRR